MPAWPTPDEEAELLAKLRTKIRAASSDFAMAYYDLLFEALHRLYPRVDRDCIYDAVAETWEKITEEPSRYNPTTGTSLRAFLLLSAKRDLWNRLKKEDRHKSRRNSGTDVELLSEGGKDIGDELELRDEAEWVEAEILPRVTAELTPEELAGFELLVDGERSTAAFIAVLKLGHLPPDEHEGAVKRFKDKIKLRIKRARGPHDEAS